VDLLQCSQLSGHIPRPPKGAAVEAGAAGFYSIFTDPRKVGDGITFSSPQTRRFFILKCVWRLATPASAPRSWSPPARGKPSCDSHLHSSRKLRGPSAACPCYAVICGQHMSMLEVGLPLAWQVRALAVCTLNYLELPLTTYKFSTLIVVNPAAGRRCGARGSTSGGAHAACSWSGATLQEQRDMLLGFRV